MALNHDLFDGFVVRATDLQRITASQRNKALSLLNDLERELVIELAKADLPNYTYSAYQRARLAALLDQVKSTIQKAYADMRAGQTADLTKLAQSESTYVTSSINNLVGVELASVALTTEQLKAIATTSVISGAPTSEWWQRQGQAVSQRFDDVVRSGVAKGLTNSQITAAVKSDVMGLAARNIDILVRTAVQQISSNARLDSMQANDDVIKAIQQHSTLDGRTTIICIAYSGKTYSNDADHKPLDADALPFVNDGGSINGIPRHWGCRSYWIPVVKSWNELGAGLKTGGRPAVDVDAYFRTRLKAKGLTDEQVASTIRNAQASMDGAVPDTMNYEQWLKTKPEAFQREQLGPTRFNLWKKGQLPFTKLVDRSGDPLTVEELLERSA